MKFEKLSVSFKLDWRQSCTDEHLSSNIKFQNLSSFTYKWWLSASGENGNGLMVSVKDILTTWRIISYWNGLFRTESIAAELDFSVIIIYTKIDTESKGWKLLFTVFLMRW